MPNSLILVVSAVCCVGFASSACYAQTNFKGTRHQQQQDMPNAPEIQSQPPGPMVGQGPMQGPSPMAGPGPMSGPGPMPASGCFTNVGACPIGGAPQGVQCFCDFPMGRFFGMTQ
jgi:hypothetical protein